MILAPRPPFRASEDPKGSVYQGFQQAYRTTVFPNFGIPRILGFPGFWDSWVLRAAPRATVQGVPGKGFRRKHSSVPVSDVPARLGIPAGLFRASPRVGRQAGKPAPGQSPPRLAPNNPEDLLQRLEEIHRGDQPPRMGEIPGETPGDHINRKKRKRSGARVKALRTYRENEKPRIAAGIFLWDTLQLVLSSPKL